MVEIKTYFAETAYKNEYYNYMFSNLINNGILTEFWIVDDDEAIEKFKELVFPYNDNNPSIDIPNNERRIYVNNLKFIIKEDKKMSDDLKRIFKIVSTRNAKFNNVSNDEKLESICNCIEYLLKPEKKIDKFIILDYYDTVGYLSDEMVKKFRNRLECFRHSTNDDINQRKKYNYN